MSGGQRGFPLGYASAPECQRDSEGDKKPETETLKDHKTKRQKGGAACQVTALCRVTTRSARGHISTAGFVRTHKLTARIGAAPWDCGGGQPSGWAGVAETKTPRSVRFAGRERVGEFKPWSSPSVLRVLPPA